MADTEERANQLDHLGGKVYQAKELIGRLRESNRALISRLEEVEKRLQTAESVSQEPVPASGMEAAEIDPGNRELVAEVKRLRRERRVMRDKVSKLLERIEGLDL